MEDDGHASAHTGMPEKSVNSLATEGNSINQARKQKDLVLALSLQKRKVAEVEKAAQDEVAALKAQIAQMMQSQQGSPTLNGSGTSHPSQTEGRGVEGRRA